MDLLPDTLLNNRYRILRKLGQGGMGAVYLAFDVTLNVEVAVKVNRNPTEQSTTQFLREARLLASLRHANLPRVTDYFILDNNQHLVMDFIPGDDLEHLLKENGPQPVEVVLAWARQIGSAISYLHRQNPPVIHRDIKPANLKLTPQGEVILVDFGIAKHSDPTQATATGAVGYTPGFAPPEQYGGGRTGPYSDQFALAATLYTLLSGQRPVDSVQRLLGEAVLTPLYLLVPNLPPNVAASLEKALAVHPEERFASIDDLLKALQDPNFTYVPAAQPAGSGATLIPPQDAGTLSGGATIHTGSQPQAPAQKKNHLGLLIGGGAVLFLIFATVVVAGGIYAVGHFFNTASPTPTATLTRALPSLAPSAAASTPLPAGAATQPSPTQAPTATLPPAASPTPAPSPTATLPAATPTQAPLGNGGRIAFISNRGDGRTLQVWTMRVKMDATGKVSGEDLQQVTTSAGDKHTPIWSPDGSKILFVAPGGKDDKNRDLGLDLWVTNADGSGQPLDLTRRLGDELDPAWAPNGKWIAFSNDGRDDKVRMVFLMEADGSNVRQLSTDQFERYPAWTPDLRLAFVRFTGNNILYVGKPDDTYAKAERFDLNTLAGRLGEVAQPAWSPDGKQLAYTRQESGSERIQVVEAASTGGKIAVLANTGHDSTPAWSPDGQWILFTSRRDNNPEIYISRSTGAVQVSNLTGHPGYDLEPSWGPNVH